MKQESTERFGRIMGALLKGTILLILMLVAVYGIATMVLGRRLEAQIRQIKAKGDPVSLADLNPRISESENSASLYDEALRVLNDHRLGSQDESRWVTKLGPMVLPIVERAVSVPKCRFDVDWTDLAEVDQYYSESTLRLKDLERFLCASALASARNGQMEAAVNATTLSFKISDALKDEPASINLGIRLSLIRKAAESLREVTKNGTMDESQARHLYDALSGIDLHGAEALVLKSGRASVISFLSGGWGGRVSDDADTGMQEPPSILRPITYADLSEYLRLMDEQIKDADLPYREVRKKTLDPDSIPKYAVYSRAFVYDVGKLAGRRDLAETELRGSRILLALIAYKDRFGSYPERLSDIENRFGWKLSEDPFSGKGFVYRRSGEGFLLYSIGYNMKDDGGRVVSEKERAGRPLSEIPADIVWRMER